MIKKELLKRLPVEFQKTKFKKKEGVKGQKKVIEVSFLQNMNFQKEMFYKPVSKIINIE